jgi:hypothetical protein
MDGDGFGEPTIMEMANKKAGHGFDRPFSI